MLISRCALALVVFTWSCTSAWRKSFDKGVEAFRRGRYIEAAEAFDRAAASKPDSLETRLYLGAAYLKQYTPGSLASKKAEVNFRKALELDPGNKAAMQSLGWLQYHEGAFDQAATWYRKLGTIDPRNKDAFYWLGVIDWLKAHAQLAEARRQLHIEPDEEGPLPDDKVRREVQARIGPLYDDGIKQLTHALDIEPDSSDTMIFISLCMREKAELADNYDAYASIVEQADNWSARSRSAGKARVSIR
jgi:tetratricopeptide (TPR) repeat protein